MGQGLASIALKSPSAPPDASARGLYPGGESMSAGGNATSLGTAMDQAEYVLIDGVIFETGYLRVPDGDTVADDIVLEARNGSSEVEFTRGELDDAEHIG